MRRIRPYIFSILLVLPFFAGAQDKGFRFRSMGLELDVSKLVITLADKHRVRYGGEINFQLNNDLYAGVTSGYSEVKIVKDFYQYRSSGNYFKLGVDYNILKKKDIKDNSFAYVSARYCYSWFNQSAGSIKLPDQYWQTEDVAIPAEKLNKHIIELGGGLKAEVLRNFFLGFAVYAKIIPAKSDYTFMVPYNIPGYGNGENNINFSIEYCISYRIRFD